MESEMVLELLKSIPKGKVTTYKAIADACGSKGYMAVGQILRKNKNPKLYPCYKVVKSDGGLGGYSGKSRTKIKEKERMLRADGINFQKGRVDLKKHLYRV